MQSGYGLSSTRSAADDFVLKICVAASAFFVVEMELLFAGHGLAVPGCWVEGPLLDGGDNGFIDAMAKAAGHFDLRNFAGGVDYDIEDDVALGAAGKSGEIRLGRGKVAGEGDVDVA